MSYKGTPILKHSKPSKTQVLREHLAIDHGADHSGRACARGAAAARFVLEPAEMNDVLDKYVIENKMSGRSPNSSLWLTSAVRRGGEEVEMCAGQKWKLWLASELHFIARLLSNRRVCELEPHGHAAFAVGTTLDLVCVLLRAPL